MITLYLFRIAQLFCIVHNISNTITHCSIMLHLLYTEFQIQLHLYPQHICMLQLALCYFYINLLPEVVVVHLVKQGLTKLMKEVWVGVSFSYLKKYAKDILRKMLSYILELTTNTLPIFILEFTFKVDLQTSGKKKKSYWQNPSCGIV